MNPADCNEKGSLINSQILCKTNGLRHLPISLLRRHMGPFLGLCGELDVRCHEVTDYL